MVFFFLFYWCSPSMSALLRRHQHGVEAEEDTYRREEEDGEKAGVNRKREKKRGEAEEGRNFGGASLLRRVSTKS